MERLNAIREVHEQIESMARLHLRHGLYHSEGFRRSRERVKRIIREHGIDVRRELDPMVGLLYRRYFD